MLKQIKPRNPRSKRALEKRAPKPLENAKKILFLRGTKCSQITQDALTDLCQLRATFAKKFTKKNDIHPFEDASSLEFFSEKNDASLLVFGNSSKKRPHTITLVRTFGYKALNMLELHLNPDSFRTLSQFKNRKCAVGLTPMLLFAGTPFENPIPNEYTLLKNLFIDLFKGEPTSKVDVEGLQYIVSISASDTEDGEEQKPIVHLRIYLIQTKKSLKKLPRVEVEEMGPRMDFRIGRMNEANEEMLKEAFKKPRTTEQRPKKNITTDIIGDKIGRIHLGKQELKELQTRKMKGLKRNRMITSRDDDHDADQDAEDEETLRNNESPKRLKQK